MTKEQLEAKANKFAEENHEELRNIQSHDNYNDLYTGFISGYSLKGGIVGFVKASEGLPKRDGNYNAKYVHIPVTIDIIDGKLFSMLNAFGQTIFHNHEPIELEYLEWLDETESSLKEEGAGQATPVKSEGGMKSKEEILDAIDEHVVLGGNMEIVARDSALLAMEEYHLQFQSSKSKSNE